MKRKRPPVKCPECPQSCFCGSTKDVEHNHLGGNNHLPDHHYPFCKKDHATFHVMCKRAGVDFEFTTDGAMRLIQALKAIVVAMWMVLEMLETHLKSQMGDRP